MQGKNKSIPPLRLKGSTLGARHLPVGGRGDETLAWERIKINLLSSIGSFLLLTLTSTLCPKLATTGLKSMATLSLYSTGYLVFPVAFSCIMATSPPALATDKPLLTCSKPAKIPPPAEICLLSLAMPTLGFIQHGYLPDIIGLCITLLMLTSPPPPSQTPPNTSIAQNMQYQHQPGTSWQTDNPSPPLPPDTPNVPDVPMDMQELSYSSACIPQAIHDQSGSPLRIGLWNACGLTERKWTVLPDLLH
jgi:hypothetical protein